ncbi:MAG: MFS transporter [Actinobacteria bacterium]|nr:MFS transporter [Actinomycetota bacterium]
MRSVYSLQASNFLSGVANSVVMITIPWLVLEVTDSAAFAGLVVALSSIPSLLIAPFGGVLIQRFGDRGVSAFADLMSTASVLGFPLLAIFGQLNGWAILVLALLGALFDPLGYTARKTMIQSAAKHAKFNVDRLNGIHEGLLGSSWIIGPALGAWLIALVGAVNSFLVAAGFFLLAAIAIFFVQRTTANKTPSQPGLEIGTHGALSLGFRRLWQDTYLRVLLIAVLVIAAIYLPTESVVLPAYFESSGRPIELGLIISVLAAGSTLSAFAYGWLVQRISSRTLVQIAFIGAAFGTLGMSLLLPLPLMLLFAALLGLSWGPFSPFLNSQIQSRFPASEHPMIFSAQTSVFYAAPPLGMLVVGFCVEHFGIQPSYIGLAVVMALVVFTALFSKTLRSVRS